MDNEVKAGMITLVSSIFYVALVFASVAFTILAVQQLNDSVKYKHRYKVLSQLGLGEKERNRVVFTELLIYFLCPLVLPVIVSFIISVKINQQLLVGTQMEGTAMTFYMGGLLLFLTVYNIYFFITYRGFIRNING